LEEKNEVFRYVISITDQRNWVAWVLRIVCGLLEGNITWVCLALPNA